MNRHFAALSAVLTILILTALPAAGQFYERREISAEDGGSTYSLGTYMDNPCTATQDYVLVDYQVYLYQELLQSTSSAQRYYLDDSTTMGSSQYAASGSATNDVAYSVPFTVRNYYKVNTYDNFHVVTVIDFNPSTRETSVSVETACGDGTPGSAQ